jgi:hypothetical protein
MLVFDAKRVDKGCDVTYGSNDIASVGLVL